MTGSQYKNIINKTLNDSSDLPEVDIIKSIFDNLGVAFPNRDIAVISEFLNSNTYLGWRECTPEHAQRFADLGIAAIAVDLERVIIIYPNEKIGNLSCLNDPEKSERKTIKTVSELQEENSGYVRYYSYSYGYKLEN